MRNRMLRYPVLLAALAAVGAGLPAHADVAAPALVQPVAAQSAAAPPDALAEALPARLNPLRGKRLDSSDLATRRGGTDIVSDMKLSGVVAGNRAINVISGANMISDGAFANASGLPVVIQNSGSNVLIQNATIVNVQVN